MIRRKIFLLRWRTKYLVFMPFIIVGLYFLGLFSMLIEKDFKHFQYPLEVDVLYEAEQLRFNRSPILPPINFYNFPYISNCKEKCLSDEVSKFRVIYIVKSAAENFVKRAAIRKTWGFENRFSDVPIRTVFILGEAVDNNLQSKINREILSNGDIVQAAFRDNYYNNTIKMMMAMKWAITFCGNSKFYFFVDDDMYVSTKNLLKFLRNPLEYPGYLETPVASLKRSDRENLIEGENIKSQRNLNQVIDIDLPDDAELYGGYGFPSSRPQRHMFSKWYIPVSEYPFNRYPPYITAGAFVLSREALFKMYYASFYTKHFRFDDIYIALLAKKVNIEPLHNSEFYFYKKRYSNPLDYKYVVASHGYGIPKELKEVWNEQKMAGNA